MTQTAPPDHSNPQLALCVDGAGLTVYANKAALLSLAEQLQALAQQNPDDCHEFHTRLAFDDGLPDGQPNVSLLVDGEIAEFFSRLPPDAPADAIPCGFELTFVHVNPNALAEMTAECRAIETLRADTSGKLLAKLREFITLREFRLIKLHDAIKGASQDVVMVLAKSPDDVGPGLRLRFYSVADLRFFDVGCNFFSQLIVENIADRGWEGLNFQVRDCEEEWAKFYCERFDYELVS